MPNTHEVKSTYRGAEVDLTDAYLLALAYLSDSRYHIGEIADKVIDAYAISDPSVTLEMAQAVAIMDLEERKVRQSSALDLEFVQIRALQLGINPFTLELLERNQEALDIFLSYSTSQLQEILASLNLEPVPSPPSSTSELGAR